MGKFIILKFVNHCLKFLTCNLYIDAWFVKINFLPSANLYGLPREVFNSFMKLKWNFVTYVWGFKAIKSIMFLV